MVPAWNYAGQFVGGTITVYQTQRDGVVSCLPLADAIAHEIGHFLGLADLTNPSCAGDIMGTKVPGTSRAITDSDCNAVSAFFSTHSMGDYGQPVDKNVSNGCPVEPCGDPLILNFGRGDYALSGSDAPVSFDLNANGIKERIGWTAEGTPLAFLFLDSGGDGVAASGRELFGNYMIKRNGSLAINGFDALGDLDSNHDGQIDVRDEAWPKLRVWFDWNHDGICQKSEVMSAQDAGLRAIHLSYQFSPRKDQFGNALRFKGGALFTTPSGGSEWRDAYDVFFVRLPGGR